jgi:hypothetical protein
MMDERRLVAWSPLDLFETLAGAGDFLEDGLDACGPRERCRGSIPSGEKLVMTRCKSRSTSKTPRRTAFWQ